MSNDHSSIDVKVHIRALYLWERDGRPDGRLATYLPKARVILDQEALITAPIDEASLAGALLTNPPTGVDKK
jgi:hypothetical protein